MSRFNQKVRTTEPNSAGFKGFSRTDAEAELVSVVLNSMLAKDSYYESFSDRVLNVERLFKAIPDEKFLLQLLVFTRTTMNLRSISHLLAVLALENIKGVPELRRSIRKVMIRPDDATEIVALWNARHKENIPNALRRAIKDNLEDRWDAYQLRKYFGAGKTVKVPDLIKMTHPKDTKGIFQMALEGNLPAIDTAQTVNTSLQGVDRGRKYASMIAEGKLGLMGALKNTVNMLDAGANMGGWHLLMDSEKAIKRSRVLPFRFAQAYIEVGNMSMDMIKKKAVLDTLEKAFVHSASNLGLAENGDRVALLLDESASMGYDNTSSTPFFIGKVMMASVMSQLNPIDTVGLLWADRIREVNIDGKPLEFVRSVKTQGGGTNLGQAMDALTNSKTVVDVMYVFTDMQQNSIGNYGWGSGGKSFSEALRLYKEYINKDVKVVFWNLEGYGGAAPISFNLPGVVEVSGYSDVLLSMVPYALKGEAGITDMIKGVEL